MGKDTNIQWTDHTWPITTGCDDESPGCLNCYSKVASYRMGLNPNPKVASVYSGTVEKRAGVLRWTGLLKTHPDRLDWPLKWRKPARIFVGSMSDLFHPEVPDDFIEQVFAVMNIARHHTFQVLTKRAERMAEWMSRPLRGFRNQGKAIDLFDLAPEGMRAAHGHWPLPNVWLGVSVEDQKRADERIPRLLRCPAAVRFLSVEPMLESIDLRKGIYFHGGAKVMRWRSLGTSLEGIGWVIVGGESGSRARPFDLAWARSIVSQCKAANVNAFVKQMGSNPVIEEADWSFEEIAALRGSAQLIPLNDEAHPRFRVKLKDSHGGDWDEWEPGLRVREFPTPREVASVTS